MNQEESLKKAIGQAIIDYYISMDMEPPLPAIQRILNGSDINYRDTNEAVNAIIKRIISKGI